mmetsp:Transcript_60150/g.158237  ORF Transcript_60150/g.158237 Transcript_60150/m.158237 type:complete len:345 (-) Transcript_60150:255-1289(-)
MAGGYAAMDGRQDAFCGSGGLVQECTSACDPVEETGELEFVGFGKGCYVAQTQYEYVGTGGGEYDIPRRAPRSACLCCSCTGLICWIAAMTVGILALLGLVFFLQTDTQTSSTTHWKFDCDAGYAYWEHGWSKEKKEYCCKEAGKGCKPTLKPSPLPSLSLVSKTTTTTTKELTTSLNMCNEGSVVDWTASKKDYCCKTYQNGCDTSTTAPLRPTPAFTPAPTAAPAPTYDCNAEFSNWELGWSEPKKIWCCTHVGKGCAAAAPALPALPFDCNAAFEHWYEAWSPPKKTWCCHHASRGCAPPPPAYDCNAGFEAWQTGWSVEKKAWCCTHASRGCPVAAGGCE